MNVGFKDITARWRRAGFRWTLMVVVTAIFGVSHGGVGAAKSGDDAPVVVLVSMKIRPYLDAVGGVSDYFDQQEKPPIHVFYLDDYPDGGRQALVEKIVETAPRLLISVGPDAARFSGIALRTIDVRKIYTMVLSPDKVLPASGAACGIPLNIAPEIQLAYVKAALPGLVRIGLIFDPIYNAAYAKQVTAVAAGVGLTVVPLEISSRKQLPDLLTKHWEAIDTLWLIPDRTVISEGLVRYIIKEAIVRRVAVIGYNRFFYESGAALSFVFDYRAIGRQTARLGMDAVTGETCEPQCPRFDTWLNLKVTKKIGINALENQQLGIVEGP